MWVDFHDSLIFAIREQLNPQIRPNYFAKVEENLFIHEFSSNERHPIGRADVGIIDLSPVEAGRGSIAMAAPYRGTLALPVDIERHPYLEIRDRDSELVVTVIEVLSPANKLRGADRDLYVAKRQRVLASQVHLVELDLMRAGPRMPLDGMPSCDYCAIVSRYQERPSAGIWPAKLREVLAPIPIPLGSPDADAKLDIKSAIDRVYDSAGYENYAYRRMPQPPLSEDDAVWAKQFVPGK